MSRFIFLLPLLSWLILYAAPEGAPAADRPNVLWITCEDMSPNLGCFGDTYAVTPNIDRFASEGVRYTNAFAPIGVCAPSRSTLILGMYACSVGTHHMRCQGTLPEGVKCFSQHLRAAGYYCTNNVKTDYNFPVPEGAWDESSAKAHFRNRPAGRPFFAVFNFTSTHESQVRLPEAQYQKRVAKFTEKERHDPAKAAIPPYLPDTPEVRRDLARYADNITFMDKEVAGILKQLADDGLADETIVFFFSDHGAGLPRSKRWLYDSSLRVPLIIRFPEKYASLAPGKPGTTTDRLVSFVDFGPTVLSLCGVKAPAHMQGTAFLGEQSGAEREHIFGFRDRMDERIDMIRCVRDKRYKYIRNYLPHLPYFQHQHIGYMYEMPTMKAWQRLADAKQLAGPAATWMAMEKPAEELYDTAADPHEIHNLARSPERRDTLNRLRVAMSAWQAEIVDLGFLPEADLRARFAKSSEYDDAREEPRNYPRDKIAAAANLASDPAAPPGTLDKLLSLAKDGDGAVRYWAAIGVANQALQVDGPRTPDGPRVAKDIEAALTGLLKDAAPWVQVAAADSLCRLSRYEAAVPVLQSALSDANPWVRLQAINVLDRIDEKARPAEEAIVAALEDENEYVVRVARHAVEGFDAK
ncbi:MAG: sulfatase-like hydrolase/transferase [Planctomycetia bacterium]|nr:sulfatase-like hydrolase/transferase [Planctomycetia bacterium]